MSTSLEELDKVTVDPPKNSLPTKSIAWSWQDPTDFVKDLRCYNDKDDEVSDLSGAKLRWAELEKEIQQEKDKVFQQTSNPVGSNANWGRITQPEELQGAVLEEVGIKGVKTPIRCAEFYQDIGEYLLRHQKSINFSLNDHARIAEHGELSAPILKAFEEEDDADTTAQSSWFCKGCSKIFATKASLKRHHDRKKSCKEICEKPVVAESVAEVPEKPYVIDWIEEMTVKAISGDSEGPYCKHCDVEFANKSNLNKHLSKSVACDKLAKQELVKLIQAA
jgi:hypothetical protein